jgi:membrane protease YdiL (CAAX protease family)
MHQTPESNHQLENQDVFGIFNQYFLLFFSLSCILSSVFVQQMVVMTGQLHLAMVVGPLVGIVLPVFLLTNRFPPGFRKQMRIGLMNGRRAGLVFLTTLASIIVIDHVSVFTQHFFPVSETYVSFLEDIRPDGVVTFMATFVGLCVVVPFSEEVVFRGMIQRVFARNMSAVIAISLSAIFFGGIHLNPPLLPSLICFGLLVGFLFHVTNNLSYTILSHATLNGIALLKLSAAPGEIDDLSLVYLEQIWTLPVAAAVVFLLLRQLKKEAANLQPPQDVVDDVVPR